MISQTSREWLSWSERTEEISQEFLQFIILWVSFNAFYSDKYKGGDKEKVKEFAKENEGLYEKLKSGPMQKVLIDFKGTEEDERDSVVDARFWKDESKASFFGEEKQSATDFFIVIYQIRCNLLHGDKMPTDSNKRIVEWAYNYFKIFWEEFIKCKDIK